MLSVTEHQAEFPAPYSESPLATYFTHGNVHAPMLRSQFLPLFFPRSVHKSALYVCVSIPALRVGSSAPFSKFHIYAFIYDISFVFLTHFTL